MGFGDKLMKALHTVDNTVARQVARHSADEEAERFGNSVQLGRTYYAPDGHTALVFDTRRQARRAHYQHGTLTDNRPPGFETWHEVWDRENSGIPPEPPQSVGLDDDDADGEAAAC